MTADPFPGTYGKKLRTAEDIVAFLKLLKKSFYYQEVKNRVQEIINFIERNN